MDGIEKYTVKHERNLAPNERFIEYVDARVRIAVLMKDFFQVYVPDTEDTKSWKTYCPFANEHPDGGIDKNFRVFVGTNSAYCWTMHGYMTPCSIMAIFWGTSRLKAAKKLADMNGLGKRPWRELFAELAAESELYIAPSGEYVIEALKMYLNTKPEYVENKYDPNTVKLVSAILNTLETLLSKKPNEEHLREWLTKAKQVVDLHFS